MDRKYIEKEQVVQRYLTGDLLVREAREFEQYCLEHPDILKDLPIPVRLKAKLAKPQAPGDEMFPSNTSMAVAEAADDGFDDDDEEVRRIYGGGVGRGVVVVLVLLLLTAAAGVYWYAKRAHELEKQVGAVQQVVHTTQVQAVGSIQQYTLDLSRAGPPSQPTLALHWPQPPILMEMKVNVTGSKFNVYQITIESESAGRLMQIRRIARDSNGDLRFSLNSSAFGPGNYLLKFDGYTWRGETEDYGWLRIALQ